MSFIITVSAVTSLMVFVFFYYISVIRKNNNWADYAWAISFSVIALTSYLFGGRHDLSKQFLITFLVILWSARLLVHLVTRSKSSGEIFKYKNMRSQWKDKTVIYSLLKIYLLNWILANIVALPVVIMNSTSVFFDSKIEIIGIMVWAIGFIYETVADYQLYHFKLKKSNEDKIFTGGLWKYSRHPNYLGEILMWTGLYLTALVHPLGFFSIISPILITFMLLGFTGMPSIEKRFKANKDYKEYIRKTPILIPLPWRN